MIGPAILLASAAALTLMLGFEAWRLTSSKTLRLITFIGTAGLAFAAYGATKPGGTQHAALIAFFVAMVFGGRALGLFFRSRKDHDLRSPAQLLFAVAGASMLAAVAALYWR